MCDEMSLLHSLFSFQSTLKVYVFLQRGAYQHALSVLYIHNLPPRQVVRRSLLFFFMSLRRVRKVFTVASVRTVLDVTNVVIPIEMTFPPT